MFTVGSGASNTVCAALRTGGPLQFELKVAAVVDPFDDRDRIGSIADVLRWYAAEVENLIRQAPEQYGWVHRRWEGRPPERKRRPARLYAERARESCTAMQCEPGGR